ncbi:PREDICTED: uncharacterized protein LOC109126960 [Camelina sativa]|uniref:Uncharacterized protein LOC109126960 n=1 Tax=Camelina sativa TaxID=90675 RepID=A0ABM1QIC2_CAMSA|nr:PREDICTED: uncharacterized protein LOC109126960 [Camelina sativa]
MEKEDDYTASFCLSFNSYTTNDRTAETIERVRLEFSDEHNDDEFEFPVFNQNVIGKDESPLLPMATVTTQLRDLFLHEDQSFSSSSSSSDEEEVHVTSSEKSLKRGWRKSSSTGASSSTSWRISDLLKRSYSEGKQSLKLLNSNSRNRDESTKKKEKKVCAHEKFYLRNKAKKNEDKRKSYLPYKQHVVGFFFTVK